MSSKLSTELYTCKDFYYGFGNVVESNATHAFFFINSNISAEAGSVMTIKVFYSCIEHANTIMVIIVAEEKGVCYVTFP